ncbi:D-alanyl-D-alanine carboxypeptidase family protein [Sporosarcina jiandibaonis]|uniref:D-alanyl-D-alanine carboxypeptidase family protein n=1 Tax=Sporosarcina jiandibaonis TaxID=2715535 RepID=UPI0015554D3F|nr:D-alanyl-D-alanine carboxypeptidase family protein [Sporosarcina jiandibaonis]
MKYSFIGKVIVVLTVFMFSLLYTEVPFGIGKDSTSRAEASTISYQTTTNLKMRKGASTKHKIITTIPKGKKVTYVSKSGSWFNVKYGNKTGFINSKYLKKVTAPAKNAAAKTTSSKQYQTTTDLNMRTGASTKHKIVIPIPKGKKVTYVSKSGSWFKVKYGNKTGFASSKYLKQVSGSTKTTKKSATSKQYQTTTTLNMRTGASTKHKVIISIPKDKKVNYVSKSGSWFKVKYGNKTGFINSKYLKNPSKVTVPAKPIYVKGILMASKTHPLPSNYAPGESKEARRAFNKMSAAAKKHGFQLTAFSTYRSYSVQKQLYAGYVARDGKAEADRFSARPGTSEHQTGLAFDISEVGKYSNRFNESNATKWLAKNSYKYGFIVRYPEGKEHITGYMYEPWHFRYLGVDAATKIYKSGLTLEEYLGIK